ncbi:hypothetical protein NliqN6_4062 [Naganishia liquefaciens]|uniref:PAN2-PAN3 deadenylation complex subunit PAN3 n=1 Tax=Naganishia liquefaciens TaxID=104408 RepID=A0A8H3TVT9_9TREE|nr:hypothetical protein NliqN6_4062 [Naganishia liquefaciens]
MAQERPRKGPTQGLPPAFVPAAAAAAVATAAASPKWGHAVAIKAPTPDNTGISPQKATSAGVKNDTTQRLCRNVLIYGSCRFQDKGCVYAHSIEEEDKDSKADEKAAEPELAATPSAFSLSATSTAPVFKPGSKIFVPPSTSTASVLVPSVAPSGQSEVATLGNSTSTGNGVGKIGFNSDSLAAPAFVPRNIHTSPSVKHASAASTPGIASHHGDVQTDSFFSPMPASGQLASVQAPVGSLASPSIACKVDISTPGLVDGMQTPVGAGGTTAATAAAFVPSYGVGADGMSMSMISHDGQIRGAEQGTDKTGFPTDTRVLDHHLYSAPLPHTANLPQSHLPLHNFFLPGDLYSFLHERTEAKLSTASVDATLPAELHVYHSLHELIPEATPQERSPRVFGYVTDVYRAKCRLDGRLYCLRRVEGFKLAKEAAFSVLDKWRRIRHPNIVSVREAFTTRLFSDASVVFAYDYHPKSKTLYEEHLGTGPGPGQPFAGISERILWSYVAQISNGLKAIHTAGLACRTVEPTKILLTGRNRVRLNCCSIFDVLTHDSNANNIAFYQQDDLLNFGKLLVSLCCGSTAAVHALPPALDHIQANYSPDFKLIIMYLIGKPGPTKTIDDILVMMGPRILNEFDAMQNYADSLESGMEAELENGRVARLLIKLGFINERPEFQQDTRWSETGDRYVLKLFRDYVFHSVDEIGNPVIDLTHVLAHLNKTDASLDEKIMLIARDDQSCLIVSYKDIRKAIDMAYMELLQSSGVIR